MSGDEENLTPEEKLVAQRADWEAKKDDLPDAAKRALAEAEARRAAVAGTVRPKEYQGQKGPEPTRYGDWEKKGIISDF